MSSGGRGIHGYGDASLEEHRAEDTVVLKQAQAAAALIQKSKHMVVFTGAGISTSVGMLDFRGPKGVWTLKDKGLPVPIPKRVEALPTPTHMALSALASKGIVKHVVSQNTDGLHLISGLDPVTQLCELHGNRFGARCSNKSCRALIYLNRTVRQRGNHVHDHKTPWKCPKCKKASLEDTIINFGETLNDEELNRAFAQFKKADLALLMGTSMKVTPACDLPKLVVKNGGNMVLVNLQETPADGYSSVRVFKETDTFMKMLMKELDITIPAYQVKFTIDITQADSGKSGSSSSSPPDALQLVNISQKSSLQASLPRIKVSWDSEGDIAKAKAKDEKAAKAATLSSHAPSSPVSSSSKATTSSSSSSSKTGGSALAVSAASGVLNAPGVASVGAEIPPPPRGKGIVEQMMARKRNGSSSTKSRRNRSSTSSREGKMRVTPSLATASPNEALPVTLNIPKDGSGSGKLIHIVLTWTDVYKTVPESFAPLHLSRLPTSEYVSYEATWNAADHQWTVVSSHKTSAAPSIPSPPTV